MALIKREILTSRKVLSTKSCTRNQFLFCKLVEFWTWKLFQIRACVISARKAKHLDVTTMFTYSHDGATADWLNLNTRNEPVNNDVSRCWIFPRLVGAQRQHPRLSRLAVLGPHLVHAYYLFKMSHLPTKKTFVLIFLFLFPIKPIALRKIRISRFVRENWRPVTFCSLWKRFGTYSWVIINKMSFQDFQAMVFAKNLVTVGLPRYSSYIRRHWF